MVEAEERGLFQEDVLFLPRMSVRTQALGASLLEGPTKAPTLLLAVKWTQRPLLAPRGLL